MPPLQEAVYWIEHTLRHDTNFLTTQAVELTWYQYMLLDVALVATFIIIFTTWLIYKLLSLLYNKRKYIRKNGRKVNVLDKNINGNKKVE